MMHLLTSLLNLFALIANLAKLLFCWARIFLMSRHKLAAEIIALRSQLALYQLQEQKGIIPKPKCTRRIRLTWVLPSKVFSGWKDLRHVVKPETVIRWHREGFRLYWRHRSRRKGGRPEVRAEMRALIRKVAGENPLPLIDQSDRRAPA